MWEKWTSLLKWFKDSETILFARLQMLVGIVWGVLITTDLTPLATSYPKAIAAWLFFSGVVTEAARRARGGLQ